MIKVFFGNKTISTGCETNEISEDLMARFQLTKFVAKARDRFALRSLCCVASVSFNAIVLLGIGVARGQDDSFSLFEPIDLASSAGNSDRSARRTRSSAEAISRESEFSLIGTSRIGSRTSVILRHASGEEVRVPLEHPRMHIPGHEQYAVVGFDSNSVLIQYPQSTACEDFATQGVSCDAARNIATLNLRVSKTVEKSLEKTESEQKAVRDAPINPFEVLRNRPQSESSTPDRTSRFQPRRIDPADVPEGMRVISTPFGDRLIEE